MPASAKEILRRINSRDQTLWAQGNVSPNRLGWLDVPRELEREAKELRLWAETIDQEIVVLLGMGGSSLGPAVLGAFSELFALPNSRRIIVCDTTDPTTVSSMVLESAFIVVSSKSGTTLEPNVLFDYARSRVSDPKRYAIVTDPGTPLASLGSELGVNRVFANRGDIGGRYSVLSYFGLVPAVLGGYDIEELCGRALDIDGEEAVELGLSMGAAAREGRDKATIVVRSEERPFGLWVEQLIAESTGKNGTGVIPVPTDTDEEGPDRFEIPVSFDSAYELGAQFLRFELATAACGHVLQIDPFNEPNVAESKANTNAVLDDLPLPEIKTGVARDVAPFLEEVVRPGDYVSIQAYLPFGQDAALEAARVKIRDDHDGIAVTAGYGPRFLHSTGQLHKGGPNTIVAVQVVARHNERDVSIPGKPYGFETLIAAQSIGDHKSLVSHDRRVIRVALDDLIELTN